MADNPNDFVGLLLDGGTVVCRKAECFREREAATKHRPRILRYIQRGEAMGCDCRICGKELAPWPEFLKPSDLGKIVG